MTPGFLPATSPQAARSQAVVAWTFVGVQALLLAGIVVAPRDDSWQLSQFVRVGGTGLVAVGVGVGLWAAARLGRGLTPSPLPNGAISLVSRGPYRWVRHPMYTAVMLLAVGVATRSGSWLVVAQTVALIVLFNVKARWEERRLVETFPEYTSYQATTPRFLPMP